MTHSDGVGVVLLQPLLVVVVLGPLLRHAVLSLLL